MYNFPRPAGHNNGGLIQFWFVPVAWVLSVPADLNSAIFRNIVLAAGKKFLTGYATFGKLNYKEPDDDSANGTLYNQGLSGKCPCDNPALTDLFRIMKYDNRYLLIYKDVNDNYKLAGSLTEPLRFSYELKKGSAFGDYNGYEYSFACKSTKPSLFYHGSFETDSTVYDNSFLSRIMILPEAEKKNIREQVGNCIDFTFEALPGTRDVFTFRAAQDGYVKQVEVLENISGLSIEINKHVYPLWYGLTPILENVEDTEFRLRKNDFMLIRFSRTDADLAAKARVKLFPVQKTILKKSIARGGSGKWLVILNFISQTISLIDTSKIFAGAYTGAGSWTGFSVLNFAIPAGIYQSSRIVYNPERNCFDVFSRDSVTRFVVDDENPANSAFYDQQFTVVNGRTFYPLPFQVEVSAVEFIPGNADMSAKYFISLAQNAYATAMCDANDVSDIDNFIESWASWVQAGRLYYSPDLDILFGTANDQYGIFMDPRVKLSSPKSENPFSASHLFPQNPETSYAIIGQTHRLTTIGAAKYHHKTGWFLIQAEDRIMPLNLSTFRSHRTGMPSVGATRYCNFVIIAKEPNDIIFTASNTHNNITVNTFMPTEEEQYNGLNNGLEIAKGSPSINELGTRDLIHSPLRNVIFAQGMRNGNQTSGVDRVHVIDVATKTYIGYITVGNMDARSSANHPIHGNQMAIDYYDN